MAADGNGMSEKRRAQKENVRNGRRMSETDGINSKVKSDVRAESEE